MTSSRYRVGSRLAPGLIVIGVVLVGAYCTWRMSPFGNLDTRIQDELGKLKALGIATEAVDLKPAKRISESDNGAVEINRAIALYKALPAPVKTVVSPMGYLRAGAEVDPTLLEASKAALVPYKPIFEALKQASTKPVYDQHRDYSQGPMLLLPDVGYLSMIVRRMGVRAYFSETEGRPMDAIDDAKTVARLAHKIGQEPLLISPYVLTATFVNTEWLLKDMLKRYPRDSRVLDGVQSVLTEFGGVPDMKSVIGGEVVKIRIAAEKLPSQQLKNFLNDGKPVFAPTPGKPPADPYRYASYGVVRKSYELKALQFFDALASRLPVDSQDFPALIDAFANRGKEVRREKGWEYDLLRGLYGDGNGSFGTQMAIYEARRRLMLCVIDTLRYRQKHGQDPEKLASTGRTSLDPFTNKPLSYIRFATGFMIYSFGPNRKDDVGDAPGEVKGMDTDDIPYKYP